MESNNIVDAVKEGSKFGTKLSEIALKLYGPRATKRQADADAYADAKKLQTIRENPDMDIVYIDGKINARSKTPDALARRAAQRQLQESIRQEENIERVFEIAGELVEDTDQTTDGEISDDWVIRFFDYAKDIGDEDMQLLWGKILAGQIKQPNSFSLRTLDIVRNISRNEAAVFQKMLPLILCSDDTEYLLHDESLLEDYGVNYGDILALEDCGLMNSSLAQLSLDVSSQARIICTNSDHAVIYIEEKEENRKKEITLSIFSITAAAKELKKALVYDGNLEYLTKAAKIMRKRNGNITLSMHKDKINPNGERVCREEPIMTISD